MRRRLKATETSVNPKALSDEQPAVWVEPHTLLPWLKNPRRNDNAVAAVMRSIKRFGFGAPIVARKANGEIIGGHTRVKAALQLGLTRIPVRYLDLSAKEAHELAIADNKLGELASWDEAILLDVIREEELIADDMIDMGFSEDEANKFATLLASGGEKEADDKEDEIPPPPKNPITKPGDVWELGRHRLLCGDCRDAALVERFFTGVKVNVAFTSPPYASQRKYDETTEFKPIPPDEFVEWFYAVQANVGRILAPDGSWFVNIKEHCDDGQRSLYVKDLVIAHVRQWGWRFIDELVWKKNGMPGVFGERLRNDWEPVFHFAIGKPCKTRFDHVAKKSPNVPHASIGGNAAMQGMGDPLRDRSHGMASPGNVVLASADSAGVGTHSARFPAALPEFFIRAFTDPDDVVFDPFMGSGTTLVACEKLNRIAYGTEISPAYCDVIVERWETMAGQKAKRIKRQKAAITSAP